MIHDKNTFLLLTDFYPQTLENILNKNFQDYTFYSYWPTSRIRFAIDLEKTYRNGLIFPQAHLCLPNFMKALSNKEYSMKAITEELNFYCNSILILSAQVTNLFVVTFGLTNEHNKFSIQDFNPEFGSKNLLSQINSLLISKLSNTPGLYLIDFNLITQDHNFRQRRSWYISKQLFSVNQLEQLSLLTKEAIEILQQKNKKLLICDLDNTIWGGTVGDDGIINIKLGGHDPIGEAFVDIQNYLISLKNKGVLLAVASKNSSRLVTQTFAEHPEMILSESDFISIKTNWDEKYLSIIGITDEIGISLTDCVFLDDNPIEREKIKNRLPEVLTLDPPESPLNYVEFLSSLSCFKVTTQTNEDKNRTELYKVRQKRHDTQNSQKNITHNFYKSNILIEKFSENNLMRISQLLNKTNQFNLTTRRLSVDNLKNWASLNDNYVWSYRISDEFGDHGLTGIGSFSVRDENIVVEDFVLSCRIIGYGVEHAILCHLIKEAQKLNKKSLILKYYETHRNIPIKQFLDQSELIKVRPGEYFWDLNVGISFPNMMIINMEPTSK